MPPPATSLTGTPDYEDYEVVESDQFDQLARQEIEKCRTNQLKKKWNEYNEEKIRLDAEKEEHIREVRRLRDEENSKYCQRPVLNVGVRVRMMMMMMMMMLMMMMNDDE